MPDYKPNQFVRVFAVLALIAALVLVVVVVATSNGGGGEDGGGKGDSQKTHISKAGRQAVRKGVWIVREGDTLGAISLKTGIDVTTLQALNPDLDPQTLIEGQRIALR
jgi:LysM repeat protein